MYNQYTFIMIIYSLSMNNDYLVYYNTSYNEVIASLDRVSNGAPEVPWLQEWSPYIS